MSQESPPPDPRPSAEVIATTDSPSDATPVSPDTPPAPLAAPIDTSTQATNQLHQSDLAIDEADDVYTPAPKTNPVVDGIKKSGLYCEPLGKRRHRLTCPWCAEHPPGSELHAIYTEPHSGNPFGRFSCDHRHTERKTTTDLIEHVGLILAQARTKPRIRVSPGDSHLAAGAGERVLAADGTYFHAGGQIVRIVHRLGQGVSCEPVNDQTLASVLADKVDWEKKGQGKDWGRCDPPSQVIQMLSNSRDRPYLQALNGLARQPYLRRDGTLVTTPGFDAETGIFATFKEADYKLPEPTLEAARQALGRVKRSLKEFEFASHPDRAAAQAALFTAVLRPALPLAPAFNISATRSGSGKSYLAKFIAFHASPDEPYNISYPTKSEEASKVVLAMLLEKPAVILFDDMQTDWRSFGAINKALTSETTTERVLGSSRTATASTNVLILGTGNNIEPERDMRRRVVTIRLASRHDQPALRSFSGDPVEVIRKDRPGAVVDVLTIIMAFKAAGSPMTTVQPIGTYKDWSNLCRQPLLWLGEPDPATSLIEQVSHDSDQDLLSEFLAAWHSEFGSRPMTVRKFASRAAENAELLDILAELPVVDGKHINPNKLGWYLKRQAGRRAGGYQIESAESSERRAWRVVTY